MVNRYILSADWHIRATRPQFRVDEYDEAILKKIEFIVKTANKYDANVIVAGDLVHNIRVGTRIINRLIKILKNMHRRVYAVPGQHDMENHAEDMIPSPYLTLAEAGVIIDLSSFDIVENIVGVPWKGEIKVDPKKINDKTILVVHHAVTPKEPPFFLQNSALSAKEMMDSCSEFNFIVCGDYHAPHRAKNKRGQILVNCGCISRANKDQYDFQPCIYYLDTENKKFKEIPIPIEPPEVVFHIPKNVTEQESKFADSINGIIDTLEKEERPDFITTVKTIMSNELFTDRQREIALKIYNEARSA